MAQVVGGSRAKIGSEGSGVRPGSKPGRHLEMGQSPDDGGVGSSRGADRTTGGQPQRPPRTAEADATEPEEDGTVLTDTGTVLRHGTSGGRHGHRSSERGNSSGPRVGTTRTSR